MPQAQTWLGARRSPTRRGSTSSRAGTRRPAASHEIIGCLLGKVASQPVRQEAWDRDRPPLVDHACAEDHPTVDFGDWLDNLDPAASQVEAAGRQGHHFAPSQAGIGQQLEERLIGRAGLGQGLYLIMGEKALGPGDEREGVRPRRRFLTRRPSRTAAGECERQGVRTAVGKAQPFAPWHARGSE
jgi:hypothetical protein